MNKLLRQVISRDGGIRLPTLPVDADSFLNFLNCLLWVPGCKVQTGQVVQRRGYRRLVGGGIGFRQLPTDIQRLLVSSMNLPAAG